MKILVKDSDLLKREIYKTGNTLKSFSEIIDMDYTVLSRVLNQKKSVGPAAAKRIADELFLTIEDLFTFRK